MSAVVREHAGIRVSRRVSVRNRREDSDAIRWENSGIHNAHQDISNDVEIEVQCKQIATSILRAIQIDSLSLTIRKVTWNIVHLELRNRFQAIVESSISRIYWTVY